MGTLIALDEFTRSSSFGHFARVLVDIDLLGNMPNEISVERDSYAFFSSINYEKLPLFCNFCNNIGHVVTNYNKKASWLDDKMKKDKISKQEDLQILANFWGQVENNERDVATNMNNSATTTNNFKVVLLITQRNRTSKKKVIAFMFCPWMLFCFVDFFPSLRC